MSLLSVSELSYEFSGGSALFSGVTLSINPSDHVGLIGPNGAGKSTFLRLLGGELQPVQGTVVKRRGLAVAMGHQYLQYPAESLFDFVLGAAPAIASMRAALCEEGLDDLVYAERINDYHDAGGYTAEAEAARILAGLGFAEADWERATGTLSGGEWARAQLARVLSSHADLVILDEPTNHLDAKAREWLQEELDTRQGACVVASHDRALLAGFARKIVEIERGRVRTFQGGYESYREAKQLLSNQEWAAYEAFERRKAAMELAAQKREELAAKVAQAPPGVKESRDFYARKAAKVAQTGRMLRERVTAPEKQVQKPWEETSIAGLSFEHVTRSSELVLFAKGVSKAFGASKPLFDELSFYLYRGGRLVIAGANGAGKTTLLNIIAGVEKPDSGEVHFGANVQAASVAQILEKQFDYTRTPLELLGSSTNARTLLACLKVPVTCLNRPLAELSGGERTKVALASILNSRANLLLLDEPTNHLEVEAMEALELALQRYPGAIVVISHDAAFIEALQRGKGEVTVLNLG